MKISNVKARKMYTTADGEVAFVLDFEFAYLGTPRGDALIEATNTTSDDLRFRFVALPVCLVGDPEDIHTLIDSPQLESLLLAINSKQDPNSPDALGDMRDRLHVGHYNARDLREEYAPAA